MYVISTLASSAATPLRNYARLPAVLFSSAAGRTAPSCRITNCKLSPPTRPQPPTIPATAKRFSEGECSAHARAALRYPRRCSAHPKPPNVRLVARSERMLVQTVTHPRHTALIYWLPYCAAAHKCPIDTTDVESASTFMRASYHSLGELVRPLPPCPFSASASPRLLHPLPLAIVVLLPESLRHRSINSALKARADTTVR